MHIQTSEEAVEDLLTLIRAMAEEKQQAGFVTEEQPHSPNTFKDVYVRAKKKVFNGEAY